MHGSRKFCHWGSRPYCQKTALTMFLSFFFCHQLIFSFHWGSRKLYCSKVSAKGVQQFPGVGGGGWGAGVQMLISIETHITCDFLRTPFPLLDPRMDYKLDKGSFLVIRSQSSYVLHHFLSFSVF